MDGNGKKETHLHLGHGWSKAVAVRLILHLKVAYHNDVILSYGWCVISISFDGGDCYYREGVIDQWKEELVFLFRNIFLSLVLSHIPRYSSR